MGAKLGEGSSSRGGRDSSSSLSCGGGVELDKGGTKRGVGERVRVVLLESKGEKKLTLTLAASLVLFGWWKTTRGK